MLCSIETSLNKNPAHTLNNELLFLASRINHSMGNFTTPLIMLGCVLLLLVRRVPKRI
jgi:hypothetical protein